MRLRFDILLKQRSIHELSEGNPVRKTRMQGVSLSDVFTQTTGFMPLGVRPKSPKEGRSLHFSKGDKADIREQPNHLTLFNAYKENIGFSIKSSIT